MNSATVLATQVPARPVLLTVLAIALGYVLYRTVTGRPAWITIALLTAIIIPTGYMEYRWWQTQQTVNTVSAAVYQKLTGRTDSPGAHCQRFTEGLLYVAPNLGQVMMVNGKPDPAIITLGVCQDLSTFLHSDKREPTLNQIGAVAIVTHETVHLTGNMNEASTECTALQTLPYALTTFGMPTELAQKAAAQYARDWYPRERPEYRDGRCTQNGEWDRTPGDGNWP